jgi:lactate permease
MDAHTSTKQKIDRLHEKVAKGPAVTGHQTPAAGDFEKAEVEIVPVSSTGTAVFLAALLSGLLLGVSPKLMASLFLGTVRRMVPAMVAIFCMLALGFVTKYSGMDAVLGLAFTRTGPLLYPLFGTMLGWLGVALTGSDTSSNVLFGNLQKITAQKLGLSPILMASANTTGGVMGKMIDAQSIVVAAAATGEGGREGELLRKVLWHSVALALLVGLIVWTYAHAFPAVVVTPSAA